MTKRILITLLGLILLIAGIAGIKTLQIRKMIAQGSQFVPPPEIVTTAVAEKDSWESLLTAVGSLEAVRGVTVSAELSGKVVGIEFEAGSTVQKGDILLRQDTSSEKARLPGAEAAVALARSNLDRYRELLQQRVISQAEYDSFSATYKQAVAEADNIRATIEKKTVRAPFGGRLGIRLVNLGQILNEGEAIVSLQAPDPIYANFLLPQQDLTQLGVGMAVRVTTDALPGETIEGTITAINPEVDAATRNIRLQATVPNPGEKLRPGMFASVAVVRPVQDPVLTIPATAVLYAPYSDSVFVVEEKPAEQGAEAGKVLRQQFVRLGRKHGDFVAVASGLEEGETVVSTGVFKLRNGQAVVVDNTLSPEFKLAPTVENN
ncbi:MexH family multidrug efflux RND transporter periplasmic adaptor subunit [Desulfuromonas versatilis]|uniref:MexH family multidrug efflux RND transporter periplasmic adaptor subunit n=1 Tax=Desulfuromonas versatilis TaxID=2802975 RepID=A0ABN6DXE0_9BACT|nr:efflux RND transporter periplasmic adaptor subunit [Desulfuromonas versatilis]BCR04710.1 MexH family multidrug efflux RND transporter periplasmic adaptor subunit [Desulfuromonas versatilis]